MEKLRNVFPKINANLSDPKFLQRNILVPSACKLKWFVDKAGSSSLTQFALTTPPPLTLSNLRSHLPLSSGRPSYPVPDQIRSSPGKLS